ncbi:MAG: LPS-assembly protein LptD, partial [Chthoniobacterales bacterium]|nr:LPS-assembly protein LptD [Chthoniobacterales bacterium]
MRRLIFLFFALLSPAAFAQTAQNSALKDQPIEITATGGTNYENGIASADENVAIHVGDADIYGDHATYNTATKEVHVEGNVRIYRGVEFYVGDRGTYNTETKAITADKLRTVNAPYLLGGDRITTMSDNGKLVENGIFTTHDSADPDFR